MQTKQTDLARLLMGTKVFVVPQFQRHYKWKAPQWKELWDDILDQYESEDVASGTLTKDDGHFLGSVVFHPAPGPASTVSRYWVIDGQQRLTTLLVLIAALRDIRSTEQTDWDPNAYTNQYLMNQYNQDAPYRLVPGAQDQDDFIATVYQSQPAGQIGRAYEWFAQQLARRIASESLDFERFQNALFLRLLVVEINTSDDDNINQIFNTINHSGMRLSAIDLIRNHSFMQFRSDAAVEVYETTWKPLEDRLGEDVLAQYLWAQLVRGNPKATQRDLYEPFQSHLALTSKKHEISMAEATELELNRLLREVDSFEIVTGRVSGRELGLSLAIEDALSGLQAWGSQTYVPIALEVLAQLAEGRVSPNDAAEALRVVLAYLVRRGLAGIPTNNLNRILSTLPYAVQRSGALVESILNELLSSGKYWPRDAELRERATGTPINLTLHPRQVEYILKRITPGYHGVATEVRHILDERPASAWRDMLDERDVPMELIESRINVIGNLALVPDGADKAWSDVSTTLQVVAVGDMSEASTGRSWVPADIDRRSELLIARAITEWPIGSVTGQLSQPVEDDAPDQLDVKTLLDAIPADSSVQLDEVAQLMALSEEKAEALVLDAGYPVIAHEGERVVGGFPEMTESEVSTSRRITARQVLEFVEAFGADAANDNL